MFVNLHNYQLQMKRKKCNKCNKNRLIKFFRTVSQKNGKYCYLRKCCKKCEYEEVLKWRLEHPEKYKEQKKRAYKYNKEYHLEYRKQNRDKLILKSNKYYKKNRVKLLNNQSIIRKIKTNNLTDYYIIHSLKSNSTLTSKQIRETPNLIEAQRIILKIKRNINK